MAEALKELSTNELEELIPLVCGFRSDLRALKGSGENYSDVEAREEILEHFDAGHLFYGLYHEQQLIAYMILKDVSGVVWIEQLYVSEHQRRQGAAGKLLREAERYNGKSGSETLYFNVHPNNDKMIGFLAKQGYNVLNLIEIRRAVSGENLKDTIAVKDHEYRY